MATALNIIRIILHVLCVILFMVGIAFALVAILTSGWQTFNFFVKEKITDKGKEEITDVHQHGLWIDYTYAHQHGSNNPGQEWSWAYKFGSSVPDNDHRWQSYQYDTLILLSVAISLAMLLSCISYCVPFAMYMSLVWAAFTIVPCILSLAAIIIFYTTATLPEYRYATMEGRPQAMGYVDYSFYLAVVATCIFAVAFLTSVGAAIIDFLLARRGERPSWRRSYLPVNTKPPMHHPGTRHNTQV